MQEVVYVRRGCGCMIAWADLGMRVKCTLCLSPEASIRSEGDLEHVRSQGAPSERGGGGEPVLGRGSRTQFLPDWPRNYIGRGDSE